MVDAEVDGCYLVARGATGAFPLDHLGQPSPQAVVGTQEGLAVGPGGMEFGVVGAAGPQPRQSFPQVG